VVEEAGAEVVAAEVAVVAVAVAVVPAADPSLWDADWALVPSRLRKPGARGVAAGAEAHRRLPPPDQASGIRPDSVGRMAGRMADWKDCWSQGWRTGSPGLFRQLQATRERRWEKWSRRRLNDQPAWSPTARILTQ
jgi:hypothetical protein